MEIREVRTGDVRVLAPDGSIAGMEELAALDAKLTTALKDGGRLLVLDCSAVRHLTSAAIRVLLLTSHKLERIQGRLVLCDMTATLRRAFSVSGFDKDFTIVPTRDEAVQRALEPLPQPPSPPPSTPAPADANAPEVDAQVLEVDARETIAAMLLDALGVTGTARPAAPSSGTTGIDPDALASALLSALRVG